MFFKNRGLPFIIGFLLIFTLHHFPAGAQRLSETDSLITRYEKGGNSMSEELELLRILSEDQTDPQEKLKYSNLLIEKAEPLDSMKLLYTGYLNQGYAYQMKSDLTPALESFFKAAAIAEEEIDMAKMAVNLGRVHIAIADVYSVRGNHDNAVHYYKRAVEMLQVQNDSLGFATAFENLGDEFLNVDLPDSALYFFNASGRIFDSLNYREGLALNTGNKGIAYAMLERDDSAKYMINNAVTQFELMENYYPIPIYLTFMSDIYLNQDNWTVALNYAQRSLDIASKYGLKDQISEANLKLSELYQLSGDYQHALDHYREYAVYKDSVQNIASVQQMANLRTNFEVARKQMEVDLLSEQKRTQTFLVILAAIAAVLLAILAIGLYRRNRFIERTKKIIESEKSRSDNLLRNILPEETAQELKEHGKVKARRFDSVSVLFADFKGFTRLSERMSPEELVSSVDYYFSQFDKIIEKYGLEKIKTMGDAYMCAGGLPFPEQGHAVRITEAAFEMAAFVEEVCRRDDGSIACFELRIGINTGPVVSGVVGTKKFVYDIWGDTVNIAARMESNSEPGRINISENTFQQISHVFKCTSRGKIDVKNKGMMDMYFVDGKKEGKKSGSQGNDPPVKKYSLKQHD